MRRTVTILFADLVGSTAFGESVDAEIARQEMGAYHQLARDVVESAGGEVIKFIGDGVMAGFGVHETAEDDAGRAVRAGLELQREFVAFVDGIQDRHGAEVGLRVGINTGEVVIDDDDADMVGDPINTAARIEGQCTPGRVLVGEQTWRLTRSTIDYEVLGEVDVKGKAEPIATFQVLAAVEDEEIATPFVGRESELAALTATLENTIADGSAQLVTVIGSPGVGKTRLAAELARRASEVTSFDLRVDRAGAATFEPVADLLRTVSELPAGLSPENTAAYLDTFVGAVDDADRLVPLLAGFVGAAPLRSTEESFWAARRLVEIVVADRPAVIVVDDIQWAEPLFLDLLEHLVEWTEGAAFLVALARPEIREIRPAFAEVGRRVSEVIALEGLDTQMMSELATGILGGKSLPPELIARLPESTEGNPLFVRELVRMLVDDNVIRETPSGWVLAIDAEAVEVPPTIISLLASRVERMDDDERRVIEAASIVGSEFARGAVGTLLPNLGAAQLDHILERLRRQEIVDPTGNYWGDEPVWRFHHVLIRDAAYRRLLKERRADMHRQVGEWTETTSASLSGEHEISIAFHYEQAHGYLRELGPLDDEALALGGRAADLLAVAAERALARDDLAAAGSLSSRALAILDTDDPRRPELLLATCEAWFGAGRVHDGTPALEELRTHTTDPRVVAWTSAFEGQYVVLTEPDRLNEVEPIVAEAAAQLTTLGDDAGVAKARLIRALILARLGRVGECEEELDAALAAARAADDRRRITAVLGAAPVAALWGPSPVARAGGRCLDIIRLLRITSASPMVEAVSIRCQAVLEAMRGRFDEARGLLAKSLAIVEELGLRHGILECRMFAGYIELLADDPAAAEPHLRVAYAGLGTLGVGADAGQAAALLSRALLRLGHVDEAAELADSSAELSGENLQTSIASRAAQAEIAARQGRNDDAKALAEAAAAIGANTDLTMDHASALLSLAEVRRFDGDDRAAATASTQAKELFAAKGATVVAPTSTEAAPEALDARRDIDLRNATTRIGEEFWSRLYDERDPDGAMTLAAPEFFMTDHRVMGSETHDRASMTEFMRFSLEGVDSVTWSDKILALRGQHHGLSVQRHHYSPSEFKREGLGVGHSNDEQFLSMNLFDVEDFDSAYKELERQFREHDGAEFADVLDVISALAAVVQNLDAEAITDSIPPDCVFVDHRPGQSDSVGLTGRMITRQFHRLTDRGAVGDVAGELEDGNGFATTSRTTQIVLVANGQLTRWEIYDEHDVETALARFDDLTSRSGPRNAASDAARRFYAELTNTERAGVEPILEMLSDDWEMTDERTAGTVFLDRVSAPGWFAQQDDNGPTAIDVDVIAIRGERLALVDVRSQNDAAAWHYLGLAEIDGDDCHRRTVLFDADDLRPALDRLNEWYVDGSEAPPRQTVELSWSLGRAQETEASGQGAALADLLHTDVEMHDHRRFSLPTIGLNDVTAPGSPIIEEYAVVVPEYLALNDRGLVIVQENRGRNETNGATVRRQLTLMVHRDGKARNVEWFEEDDVDAALARFDELTAALTRTELDPLGNQASNLVLTVYSLLEERDFDAMMELVADELVAEDRRPLVAIGAIGKADLAANYAVFLEADGGVSAEIDVIATAGERLAVCSIATKVNGADFVSPYLAVIETDGALVTSLLAFERHDVDAAGDEMHRRFVLGEGAEFAATLTNVPRVRAAFNDLDQLKGLLTDDFELVDHRSLGFGTLGRESYLGNLMNAREMVGERSIKIRRYLRLDHDVTLSETWLENADLSWPMLMLFVYRDGHLARHELFDLDDLDTALARFEEVKTAAELDSSVLADRTRGFYRMVFDAHDIDGAFEEYIADGFTNTDYRSAGLMNLDRVGMHKILTDSIATQRVEWRVEMIAIHEEDLSLWRYDGHDQTGFEWSHLQLDEYDTRGFIHRTALYDNEDLDRAIENFEQLKRGSTAAIGASGLELLVEQAGQAGFDAVDRADWAALRESFTPDATFAPRHGLTGPGTEVQNRDEFVATAEGFSKEGLVVSAREILATRGDRVGIARVTMERDGFVVVMDNLVDVNADGRILRSAMFDESDPDIGRAELENWWIESLDADQARTLAVIREYEGSIIDASGTVDAAAMRTALPEDATFNDYRPLSFGPDQDREQFINVFAFDAVGAPVTIADAFTTHWPRLTSAGSVQRIIAHYADGTEFDNAVVTFIEDGRITGSDWFEGDDLPAAVAHFDELTAGRTRGNRASEVDLEFRAAVGRRDVERLAEVVSPDAVFVDHRTLVSRPVDTVKGLVDSVHAYADQAMIHTSQLLSWRSETLALVRATFAAEDGFDVRLYTVTEIDQQGRICRFETFADEGLLAAQRRMDELWWARDGAFAEAWGRSLHDLGDAMTAGDWDSVRAVLAPDFRHIVTKQITTEGAADADRFIENMQVWTDLSGSSRSEGGELYKSTADGCVMHLDVYATDATGMVTQWASANVFVFVDGLLTYWEEFEEDDLDAAIARFDELTPEPEPRNLVLRLLGRGAASMESGGFDPRQYLSDATIVDHRTGVIPVASIDSLADSISAFDEQEMDFASEVVAWRGTFAGIQKLTRSTSSGMRYVMYNVIQVDEDARPTRFETFGEVQLDEALRRLDELWWENDGQDFRSFGEMLRAFGDGISADGWEGVRALLHPDFRHVMHQTLETGPFDVDGFIENGRIWKNLAGSVRSVVREVVRHSESAALLHQDLNAVDDTGLESQWSAFVIGVAVDGQLTHWEEFEEDDLDAAIARFDELADG